MGEDQNNGWQEYKREVLFRLDTLTDEVKSFDNKLSERTKDIYSKIEEIKTCVTILKTKAAMYGTVTAVIVSLIIQLIIVFLKNKAGG